jgi:leader peptidase (prepilin peptidase)/N-methyltransferase
MSLFFYVIIFLFGLVAGSFLNCVIYRLETDQGFIKGRSYCPHCRKVLMLWDLIPILSFFILKGRCRYCRQKISWQYPLVEFATGSLFVLTFLILEFGVNLTFGFWILEFIYYLAVICFLAIIFVYDLKHYLIQDKIIYPAIILSFIWYFLSAVFFKLYTGREILNVAYSALGAAVFFLLIVLISRGRWMGLGDVKLAFFIGLFLGFPQVLVALFLAFFLGAIIGIGLIVFLGKTFKSEVPFGPFLAVGTLVALFWGEKIVNFYLKLMRI